MTSRRAVLLLVLAVLLALGLLGAAGVQALQDRWAWRQADLDRNRLNLAISRGADSAEQLAGWVEHGSVEDAAGSVLRPGGGNGWLRVSYERRTTGWLGQHAAAVVPHERRSEGPPPLGDGPSLTLSACPGHSDSPALVKPAAWAASSDLNHTSAVVLSYHCPSGVWYFMLFSLPLTG